MKGTEDVCNVGFIYPILPEISEKRDRAGSLTRRHKTDALCREEEVRSPAAQESQ
jgi:hypothetical protein